MRFPARPLAAVLLVGSLSAHAGVAGSYRVTDLGNFFPTGVNDSAWVSAYDGRALLWRPGIGVVDLGDFGGCGACSNRANAINNAGQVAGFTWSAAETAYRAFRWQEGTGLLDLGDIEGGARASRAEALNAYGLAAGQATGQWNSHPVYGFLSFGHAARFDLPGPPLDLELHPDGTLLSIARGINDAGATAGERQTSDGWRAIVWDESASPLNLGALWGINGSGATTDSFARDINNLGQVALRLPLGGGAHTAAIWQAGVGFTTIGQLDGYNTAANAINDAGVLVGVADAVGAFGTQAFAWSEADGLVALTSRVDVASSGDWAVLDTTGISESGLIVGRGWRADLGYRAVLLSPVPEPATAVLVGLGALLLVARAACGGRGREHLAS